MTKANDRQVGGDHYRRGEGVQHWDVASRYMSYLDGCASKYVLRWRSKDGVEGLEKAKHYIQKQREILDTFKEQRAYGIVYPTVPHHLIIELSVKHDLWTSCDRAWSMLCTWRTDSMLCLAIEAIDRSIARAKTEGFEPPRRVDDTGQERPFGYDRNEEEGR